MRAGRTRRAARWLALGSAMWAVAMLAVACAPSDAGDANGAHASGLGDQDPVVVDGVASCASLSDPPGGSDEPDQAPAPVESNARSGLESIQLDCLTSGPAIDLSALRGRVTVINLWASWCGPCREEMPLLQAEAAARAGEIRFVGVDTSDLSDAAAGLLKSVGVTYPQLSDPDATLLDRLRSPGLPVTVVLRADGSISSTKIGPFDDRAGLTSVIEEASR